jgi:hypothetical protein
VSLYRLVEFDVRTVCEFPLEITEVHRFSRRQRSAFETYWRERRQLTVTLEQLLLRGIESGAFRRVDPYLCALTIIAQDESVQNWLVREPRAQRRSLQQHDPNAARYRVGEVAEFVATQTLASLIAEPSRIDAVKQSARKTRK